MLKKASKKSDFKKKNVSTFMLTVILLCVAFPAHMDMWMWFIHSFTAFMFGDRPL